MLVSWIVPGRLPLSIGQRLVCGLLLAALLLGVALAGCKDDAMVSFGAGGAPTLVAAWDTPEILAGTGADVDLFFTRSTDDGLTWEAMAPLNSNAIGDIGNDTGVQLAADGAGNWVAVWTSNENLGGLISTDVDVFVSRSTNAGVTWDPAQVLNSNADADAAALDRLPSVAGDGAGNWVAVWHSNDAFGGSGADNDILVSRSVDNGVTWSLVQLLNNNAIGDTGNDTNVQITTDGAGNWVAVWQSDDTLGATVGVDSDIFVATSSDNGATWSPVQTLNSNATGDTGNDTGAHITTDSAGNWVAVWDTIDTLGGTIGPDSDILVARSSNNGVSWSPLQTLNSNAATDAGSDSRARVAVDGAGNWVTIWTSSDTFGGSGTDNDIFVSRSVDNGANWSPLELLNSNATADTGDDLQGSLTTDGRGNWLATWNSNDTFGGSGLDNDILVSRSVDNGVTWSAVELLNSNATTDTSNDVRSSAGGQ